MTPPLPQTSSSAEDCDTAEALREREARLQSILDTVPDAVIVIDERGIMESFSASAERLFGFTAADAVGQNVSILMPSPDRELHDSYLERYYRTGERRIIGTGRVVVGQRKDGSTFPMELAVGETEVNGRRLFTGFVRDITERQVTRRRLQELQSELIHVSRVSEMGQMASALAHELNQPLTAIVNYVQACRRMLSAEGVKAPARVNEVLEKTAAQASRAGEIIRRLRTFLEKGETERLPEDINAAVDEASALALVGAKEVGVRVRRGLHPGLPLVSIDKIQIQQVVLNLVRNAIEAMNGTPRRELTVATRPVGTDAVEVAVSDTGPGLTDEVAAKLFEPFVTTKPQGMGVGLSISRSIIDAHGGRIWATPNPDGGVTFYFTLPAVYDYEA